MVRDSQLDLAKLISQQLLFRSHQITCGLTLYETLVLVQYTVHNKFFTNNHLRVGWVSSQLGFRGLGEADISPNCHVVNGIVDAHVLEQGLSFRYFLDIHCISSSKAKYVLKKCKLRNRSFLPLKCTYLQRVSSASIWNAPRTEKAHKQETKHFRLESRKRTVLWCNCLSCQQFERVIFNSNCWKFDNRHINGKGNSNA